MSTRLIYGFGIEVRRARKDRGLTLAALAEMAGVSAVTASQIETNSAVRESNKSAAKVAAALGITFPPRDAE